MAYRILLTTHHITSRAKIQQLSRAANTHRVSVLLKKTSKPPGIMICEGDTEDAARAWLTVVKGLRYKGYRFIKGELLPGARVVHDGRDGIRVVEGAKGWEEEMERLASEAGMCKKSDVRSWWREAVRFVNSGGGC
jgi:hypothetical protein